MTFFDLELFSLIMLTIFTLNIQPLIWSNCSCGSRISSFPGIATCVAQHLPSIAEERFPSPSRETGRVDQTISEFVNFSYLKTSN